MLWRGGRLIRPHWPPAALTAVHRCPPAALTAEHPRTDSRGPAHAASAAEDSYESSRAPLRPRVPAQSRAMMPVRVTARVKERRWRFGGCGCAGGEQAPEAAGGPDRGAPAAAAQLPANAPAARPTSGGPRRSMPAPRSHASHLHGTRPLNTAYQARGQAHRWPTGFTWCPYEGIEQAKCACLHLTAHFTVHDGPSYGAPIQQHTVYQVTASMQ